MTLEQHLAWLLHLMSEYPEAWKAHCWHRANELARHKDLQDLPRLLTEAMRAKDIDTAKTGHRSSP